MPRQQCEGITLDLVILISGGGTNLQSIIDAVDNGTLNARIVAIISNVADAYGLERGRKANIPVLVAPHDEFEQREEYDRFLGQKIDAFDPDLIILAGFMRILSAGFVAKYPQRILNIHPSLLPKYKGTNTHQRVLEAGDSEHGATVHLVTVALDDGPIILQARVPVKAGDTAQSLQARVLQQEHRIYPEAIQLFANDAISIDRNCVTISETK